MSVPLNCAKFAELQWVGNSVSRILLTKFAFDALKQILVLHVVLIHLEMRSALIFHIAYRCEAYL